MKDDVLHQLDGSTGVQHGIKSSVCVTTVKKRPVPEQFEMYNLTADPLETINLAHPKHSTPKTKLIQRTLAKLLLEQCRQKRLAPSSGTVPGMPSCDQCDPF